MSRQDTVGGGVAVTAADRFFLQHLMQWEGIASSRDLGPQINNSENSARQSCKRKGLVTFDGPGGYWRITDAGRAALKTAGGANEPS